jgi:hypothetical protein
MLATAGDPRVIAGIEFDDQFSDVFDGLHHAITALLRKPTT